MLGTANDKREPGWICVTCATQFAPAIAPTGSCPICVDDRQYVGWDGQQWLSPNELSASHTIRFAEEDGVTTMLLTPDFAIGQRAFLVPHDGGLVMWECLSLVTVEAVARLRADWDGRAPQRSVAQPRRHRSSRGYLFGLIAVLEIVDA